MQTTPDVDAFLDQISELEERNANLLRLEKTIERNTRMFEALLGASQEGITLTGPDGRIVRVVRGLLGFPQNSLNGMGVRELIHPDDCTRMLEAYRELNEKRQQQTKVEVRLCKPDGTWQWMDVTLTDMLGDPAVMAIVLNYRATAGPRPAVEAG